MARRIIWERKEIDTERGKSVDVVGKLGPLRAFTLCQLVGEEKWAVFSHLIPSKIKGTIYGSIEDGERACQSVVDGFAVWLNQ